MSKLPKHKRRLINLSAAVNDALRLMDREEMQCTPLRNHYFTCIGRLFVPQIHNGFTTQGILKLTLFSGAMLYFTSTWEMSREGSFWKCRFRQKAER